MMVEIHQQMAKKNNKDNHLSPLMKTKLEVKVY